MSEFAQARAFLYSEPKVFGLEAHAHESEGHEPMWSCAYSEDEGDDFRAIIGTLHGATLTANFTVSVGSLFVETGTIGHDQVKADYESFLQVSEALETLYAHARLLAMNVMASLGETTNLPVDPPQPMIRPMIDGNDEGDEDDGADVAPAASTEEMTYGSTNDTA